MEGTSIADLMDGKGTSDLRGRGCDLGGIWRCDLCSDGGGDDGAPSAFVSTVASAISIFESSASASSLPLSLSLEELSLSISSPLPFVSFEGPVFAGVELAATDSSSLLELFGVGE